MTLPPQLAPVGGNWSIENRKICRYFHFSCFMFFIYFSHPLLTFYTYSVHVTIPHDHRNHHHMLQMIITFIDNLFWLLLLKIRLPSSNVGLVTNVSILSLCPITHHFFPFLFRCRLWFLSFLFSRLLSSELLLLTHKTSLL